MMTTRHDLTLIDNAAADARAKDHAEDMLSAISCAVAGFG